MGRCLHPEPVVEAEETIGTSGTPAANQIPIWVDAVTLKGTAGFTADSSSNIYASNFVTSLVATATSGGVTTLTISSAGQQYFTGSATSCTVKLPVTSTLGLGHQFLVVNQSSGAVTVTVIRK